MLLLQQRKNLMGRSSCSVNIGREFLTLAEQSFWTRRVDGTLNPDLGRPSARTKKYRGGDMQVKI